MAEQKYPTQRNKCPECQTQRGHRPFCSQNPNYPTQKQPKPDPKKQNFVNRKDDGRRKKG